MKEYFFVALLRQACYPDRIRIGREPPYDPSANYFLIGIVCAPRRRNRALIIRIAIAGASIEPGARRWDYRFRFSRDATSFPLGYSHKALLPEAPQPGFSQDNLIVMNVVRQRPFQYPLRIARHLAVRRRASIQFFPEVFRRVDRFDA